MVGKRTLTHGVLTPAATAAAAAPPPSPAAAAAAPAPSPATADLNPGPAAAPAAATAPDASTATCCFGFLPGAVYSEVDGAAPIFEWRDNGICGVANFANFIKALPPAMGSGVSRTGASAGASA